MEIKEIGKIGFPHEIFQSFCLNYAGDYFCLNTKQISLLFQLKFKHIGEETVFSFELNRIECSKKLPTREIQADEVKIYNSCNREDKHKLMLDQTYVPKVATLYVFSTFAQISATGLVENYPRLAAQINNAGQLSLYHYEDIITKWTEFVDVSKLWTSSFYNPDEKKYTKIEPLDFMVNEIIINCFVFQDVFEHRIVHFSFSTKSGKIVICSINENVPKIELTYNSEQPNTTLKWFTLVEHNFLITGQRNGKVCLYRFKIESDSGEIQDFILANELWSEDDEIAPSFIECELCADLEHILILVVKGTFILAFLIDKIGGLIHTTVEDVGNFMITGVQKMENYKYLVCTLPGYICQLHFHIDDNYEKVDKMVTKAETDLNVKKHSIYGMVATQNRSCLVLATYPAQAFDHLVLREPSHLIVCEFNDRYSDDILLQNPTLKMTDFYDCAEMIRYNGSKNINTLAKLESVEQPQIEISEKYLYHLKLQLLICGSKVTYFKKRNQAIAEVVLNQFENYTFVIEAIHCSKILSYYNSVRENGVALSQEQLTSARCCRNFIQNYFNEVFMDDFKTIQDTLKPQLNEIVENCRYVDDDNIPLELCSFCAQCIAKDQQECADSHKTIRCMISKIQVFGNDESVCPICKNCTLTHDDLERLFDLKSIFKMCPICDVKFEKINL